MYSPCSSECSSTIALATGVPFTRYRPAMAGLARVLPRQHHQRFLRSASERVCAVHVHVCVYVCACVRVQHIAFERYSVVLVTGPQRSGTTWVACALATALGYTLLDERHPITGGNDTLRALQRSFAYLRSRGEKAVIQAPMATQVLHMLPLFPGLLVVFMARNCLDVFISQNKVERRLGGWTCAAGRTKELRKYRNRKEFAPYFDEREMICKVKQDVWLRYQQPLLQQRRLALPAFAGLDWINVSATIDFNSFRQHPLWLQGEERRKLGIKSTNCKLVAETPQRTRWSTSRWMREAETAMAATGEPILSDYVNGFSLSDRGLSNTMS